MKKLFFLAVLFISQNSFSQTIKNISVGAIVSNVASTSFDGGPKPFNFQPGISGSLAFVTKKSVHNFMYNFGNNSVAMLNAYFLPKDWDMYGVFAKSLNSKGKYCGVGIEKMEKIGNLKMFEFVELGTNFKKPVLSVGVLFNLSWSLKKN